MSVFTRTELQDIRDRAQKAAINATAYNWKYAYGELMYAADTLDALEARTEVRNTDLEEIKAQIQNITRNGKRYWGDK